MEASYFPQKEHKLITTISDQHANKGASLGEKVTSRAVKRKTLRRGRDCPTAS